MDKRDLVKIDVPTIPFLFLFPFYFFGIAKYWHERPAKAAKILLFVSKRSGELPILFFFLLRFLLLLLSLLLFGGNKEIREDSSAR